MNGPMIRLYSGLLRLYPARFQQQYAGEMAQVFQDEFRRRSGAGRWAWLAYALGDLLVSAALERLSEWRKQPIRAAWGGLGLALLVLSWLMMFFVISIYTVFVLAPWDTAIVHPELGTWQRTLNDFFATAPGQYAIALPVVLFSVYLTLRYPGSTWKRALVNLACAMGVFIAMTLASFVNNAIFPYPRTGFDPSYPGYQRSVIPTVAVATVCIFWLRWQARRFMLRLA